MWLSKVPGYVLMILKGNDGDQTRDAEFEGREASGEAGAPVQAGEET